MRQKEENYYVVTSGFWPRVSFGISSITATFAGLKQCMMRTYYDMVLIGGIRWLVNRELRQMDKGFYGYGLPHPGVECFIAQLSKLLTNYGCNLGLGTYLENLIDLLIVEGGVSTLILSLPFS
jgi:hypothetical protein